MLLLEANDEVVVAALDRRVCEAAWDRVPRGVAHGVVQPLKDLGAPPRDGEQIGADETGAQVAGAQPGHDSSPR
jgi:hypothetical protein